MSEEQTQQLLYQMQMLEGYFSELSQKEHLSYPLLEKLLLPFNHSKQLMIKLMLKH